MQKNLLSITLLILLSCFSQKIIAQTVEPDTTLAQSFEEDEENDEFEGEEFDSNIVVESGRYWDFIRPTNLKFDTSFAPAQTHYNSWDTITVNPYKVDLIKMPDTVILKLIGNECGFHPPAIGDITSNFGFRRWGRRAKFHFGVDLRMDVGDPVYASFEGVIRIAKKSADYGYMVLIRHNNGLETLYAHFSQLLTYSGQYVKAGDIIGLAGSTGRSTGPHLHFEIRFKGEKIDPNRLVYFPSGSLLSDSLQIDQSCFKHLYVIKSAKLKAKIPKYIKARRGDTLSKIARRYGISIKKLARLNRISSKAKLSKGKRLRLR